MENQHVLHILCVCVCVCARARARTRACVGLCIQHAKHMCCIKQGHSLARGPKLLSIKNYVMFVNQLTDDELTTGYYQLYGATCHTANGGMREI